MTDGRRDGTQTRDLSIDSAPLYQLSYTPLFEPTVRFELTRPYWNGVTNPVQSTNYAKSAKNIMFLRLNL